MLSGELLDKVVISMQEMIAAGAVESNAVEPSHLADEALYRTLRQWFETDSSHSNEWRKQAREDFDFVACEQWDEATRRELEAQERPVITFNRVLAVIKAVAGIEINGRHETIFIPRGTDVGDVQINEFLTQASQWMSDGCDAEDEQSEAFQDALTCGMGWCLSDDAMVRLPHTHLATTRLYRGAVIEISLENGQRLTGTPNHPVLTDKGWKPLYMLNEGDNLVTSAFLERVQGFPIEQFDNVEARLKDKIDAFRAGREVSRAVTAANDFYGDGAGSEVHIVYADGELTNKLRQAARRQKLLQLRLAGRNLFAKACTFLLGDSMLLHTAFAAEGQPALNGAHAPSSHLAGVLAAAQHNPGGAKALADSLTTYATLLTDLIGGKLLLKVEPLEFHGADFRLWAARVAAECVTCAEESPGNAAVRHSEFISDFLDWKPILEVEVSNLCGRDGMPAQFMTRVCQRTVHVVEDFPVHDVGTSLGMFVAGDIITSNTTQTISYEEDPDGKYVETKVDPLEMYWDRDARAKNLIDARRVWRVRQMQLEDARAFVQGLGVDVPDSELSADWAGYAGAEADVLRPVEERRLREENVSLPHDPRAQVYIVQVQWWERERYWRVADISSPNTQSLNDEEFAQFKQRAAMLGIDVIAVPLTRRVYKQAFLGKTLLGPVRPAPANDRFSFTCITGEKHRNKGTWFGLVRLMRDPQMWANKWLSQTLHILNSTAKGGIIAEKDAFEDQRQAEQSYAQADRITWAASGAISKQKIMQKPGVGLPTGYVNLLEFAITSIRDVTGINMELLGMRDVNQPGILEAQRKQAALTILATLFDSLRRFRKEIGRIRLNYIQNYLSDGRLIRIAGPDGEGYQLVPLLRDKTIGQYDIIVDDAPTSPNQKEQTWGMLMQLMPVFKGMMTPEAALVLLEYSPLPSKVVQAFKQLMEKPNPMQEMQQRLLIEGEQAKITDLQTKAQKTLADTRQSVAKTALTEAQAEKTRVDAVLGMAQAASEGAMAEAETARVRERQRWAQEDGGMFGMENNPFLVTPPQNMGQTAGQLPQLPELPVAGQAPAPLGPESTSPVPGLSEPPLPLAGGGLG